MTDNKVTYVPVDSRDVLRTIFDDIIAHPSRWILSTTLDWKKNGISMVGDNIVVPQSKSGKSIRGDVVVSVGDFVATNGLGRKAIIFLPEGDFVNI